MDGSGHWPFSKQHCAALEDEIVQAAMVTLLSQIYEVDFQGFSYGFRPGKSQHNALDAVSVEKAKFVVQRAKAEPIPNLSVNGGYVRQNQNISNDYTLGVSASIPLWNRNQGNIRATEAELCAAMQEVGRVENDLTERVASALREFAAARKRAEKYQAVVSKAEQAQNIATEDQRRNLSPLMVLELQRSLRQARLERLKSLGDAWKAAATISGMTIEDNWPPAPTKPADVPPAPAAVPQ
ncbi:MAG: TolC family protein [Planctomycetaceae bacterium]